MKPSERLLKLCFARLCETGLKGSEAHRSRLKWELRQIEIQEEEEYFLDLHDRKVKYLVNENNLLVADLLGLCPKANVEQEATYRWGDFPDVDVDYLPIIQHYIKDDWAPRQFGVDNVCSVGTYGSLGIKSAILDMTKVHGVDKGPIQAITVTMDDKDDEGAPLEWDKALVIYKDLREFCEKNPKIAETTQAMLERIKTAGVHAGGLITCNQRIDQFVPLEVRKVTKERPEGVIVAAWTEGLRSQDLQAVGLIKFDVLSIINLLQIATASRMVKMRHPEIKHICALPGQSDWSDTSYLNDPLCLEMANRGDLKCVFQFDSEGIPKLVREGGVDSFDDLVAYNALFRPGPLNCLHKDSEIELKGGSKPISKLVNWHDEIAYYNRDGEKKHTKNYAVWKTGKKKMLKITTKSGKVLRCSPDHILFKPEKCAKAETLKIGEKIATIS